MRKLFLLLVLLISVEGWAQPAYSIKKNRVEPKLISEDSILIKWQKFEDSLLNMHPAVDSSQIKENFDRNITGILDLQKSQRDKEKRGAIIRIGIGIALFIVLIIGLRRKTTKK